MEPLKLVLRTYDVTDDPGSAEACAAGVVNRVIASWDNGADVVVLPEFTWMALERYISGGAKLRGISALFWNQLWPEILPKLRRSDNAVVLGSVPFVDENGELRNRAIIVSEGEIFYQDKIHLTPWEATFTGGGPLRIWKFREVKIATLICLDIEIPELSCALRGTDVDLLLVPSATDTVLGVERVSRCANARAVELGCYVGVCPLVGRMESELIDENLGRVSLFAPSQSPFIGRSRMDEGKIVTEGFEGRSFELDIALLHQMRFLKNETDPAKIRPQMITVIE